MSSIMTMTGATISFFDILRSMRNFFIESTPFHFIHFKRKEGGIPPLFEPLLIDATGYNQILMLLEVGRFMLDAFRERVGEFVILPCFALGFGDFHPILDEVFSIRVLQFNHI